MFWNFARAMLPKTESNYRPLPNNMVGPFLVVYMAGFSAKVILCTSFDEPPSESNF